jgi:hypothetical protein
VDKKEYPKVLVIDPTPFNRNRNNGIVKSNLFEGWPKERLAQVDYSNMQPGFDVCERYWRLRKLDIVKSMFGLVATGELPMPQQVTGTIYNPDYAFEYEDRPRVERTLSILSPQLRTVIGEVILRLPSILNHALLRWIECFNPDVIFSVLSTGPIVRLVVNVSELRNIPIIPYYTDDWVATLYEDHTFRRLLQHSLHHWFNKCLERSPIRLTPNNVMSNEYKRRYGGRFEQMLYPEEYRPFEEKKLSKNNDDPVRFLFIGGLDPDRWGSLRHIGETLLTLRSEGLKGELLIYTLPADIEKHAEYLTLEPVMRVMGTASQIEVRQLQGKADVLVHVESFNPVYQRWTALSLSTKIPQYMMAGACILGYGPENVASMKYLSDSGVALTVGREDVNILSSALKKLIMDADYRRTLGKTSHEFAMKHHEAAKQRELFRSYVAETCHLWRQVRH